MDPTTAASSSANSMTDGNYKKAYERQKLARERAEELLEVRSRELYEANQTLQAAYDSLQGQKSQLIQKEKLSSIGLLAAGVAHELNNPIGFIKSNLHVLEDYLQLVNELLASFQAVSERVDSDPESVDYKKDLEGLITLARDNDLAYVLKDSLASIRESLTGAGRVEEIVTNLTDFARTGTDEWSWCDVNELIDSALKLVWNKIKYKLVLEKDYGELPNIHACGGQLNQVFVNIIINAGQAIEGMGTLRISTAKMGDMVRIDFEDDGPGFKEDDLMRLFDPFFTTKDVDEGTGLGLYISHSLIEGHQGTIQASHASGGGAKFTITLPIQEPVYSI